jgi:hypothetical protein
MVNFLNPKLKQAFLAFTLLVISASLAQAQNFKRQYIGFTLLDKAGKELTDAAIATGKVKVYSLREAKVSTDPHLSFDKTKKTFTYSESVLSPGIILAFVSPADTMFVSVYGRGGADRVIQGINMQRGSYVLTSNEFAGNKVLKVGNWNDYLEDEEPAEKQDISGLVAILRTKQPISLVQHNH